MISKNFNSNKFESVMCAIFSKDYDHNISIDELKDVLYSHNEEFIVKELNIIEENKYIRDKSKWEVSVTIEYIPIDEEYNDDIEDEEKNDELTFYIALIDAKTITYNLNIFKKTLDEKSYNESLEVNYAIHITTEFQNFPLEDYQRQLKLINSIVADTSVFIDISSYNAYSGAWISYTATFEYPPSLNYLYTVNAVYNDENIDDNKENAEYWLYTKGLNRMGINELEIIGVYKSKAVYNELLDAVAKLFIEKGTPPDGLVFGAVFGVKVCTFPFEEAIKKINIDDKFIGVNKEDRYNNDTLVLIAVDDDNNYHSLEYYREKLSSNPIFMLSNFETSLMREAAFEKVDYFIQLLTQYKNEENTKFLVKLGFGEKQIEHLWFEVHNFNDNGYFDATLINTPHNEEEIKLKEGERGLFSIENLTYWQVNTEDITYTPRNIYLLFEYEV